MTYVYSYSHIIRKYNMCRTHMPMHGNPPWTLHTQCPTSTAQRTSSRLLAASGYASNSASTTCSSAWFSAARCSGIIPCCTKGGKGRCQLATQVAWLLLPAVPVCIRMFDNRNRKLMHTHRAFFALHSLRDLSCSQRQGMPAAALPPSVSRLASLMHNAAAICRTAHEWYHHVRSVNTKDQSHQTSTLEYVHACMCAYVWERVWVCVCARTRVRVCVRVRFCFEPHAL